MKVSEIVSWLETEYPPSFAEEWDNVGLLVGDDQREVKKIFLALDLTEDVLDQAEAFGADMIITHHPMIFSGIKKINNHSFTGRRIIRLILGRTAYYAMHTNYDILGMADLSAEYLKLSECRVLAKTGEKDGQEAGLGRVGRLEKSMTLREFAKRVKESLRLLDVRVYGDLDREVSSAAVCTGSGKSLISDVMASGAEVYVTGDIDHHTGIDAAADGLAVIDAGHYGTEYIFAEAMKKKLQAQFTQIEIGTAQMKFPYACI